MRILAIPLVLLAVLSSVTLTAESAEAMAVCASYGGKDLYNTAPDDRCDDLACTGHDQWGWETCYPDIRPCTCPPPTAPFRLDDLVVPPG